MSISWFSLHTLLVGHSITVVLSMHCTLYTDLVKEKTKLNQKRRGKKNNRISFPDFLWGFVSDECVWPNTGNCLNKFVWWEEFWKSNFPSEHAKGGVLDYYTLKYDWNDQPSNKSHIKFGDFWLFECVSSTLLICLSQTLVWKWSFLRILLCMCVFTIW